MKYTFTLITLFLVSQFPIYSQESERFANEVTALTLRNDSIWDKEEATIIFTGSSSIRKWENLQQSFPDHQVINTGFGGSQASDLLFYLDTLVIRYKPSKVFIYEGDNDIADKKKTKDIIHTTEKIIERIRDENQDAQIVLISAKPSISRWKLKGKYKRLNRKFKRLAANESYLVFVDVWNPMLNGRKLKRDIFISDGLHMNDKGYEIWYNTMKNLIDNP